MNRSSLSEALRLAFTWNEEVLGLYRDVARKSPSKAASVLATAATEQRRALSEELQSLLDELGPEAAALQVDTEAMASPDRAASEASFFAQMRDAELADQARFSALAAGASALSAELELKLAAFALQARKRADLASDHLDLLALGLPGQSA